MLLPERGALRALLAVLRVRRLRLTGIHRPNVPSLQNSEEPLEINNMAASTPTVESPIATADLTVGIDPLVREAFAAALRSVPQYGARSMDEIHRSNRDLADTSYRSLAVLVTEHYANKYRMRAPENRLALGKLPAIRHCFEQAPWRIPMGLADCELGVDMAPRPGVSMVLPGPPDGRAAASRTTPGPADGSGSARP